MPITVHSCTFVFKNDNFQAIVKTQKFQLVIISQETEIKHIKCNNRYKKTSTLLTQKKGRLAKEKPKMQMQPNLSINFD